MSSTASPFHARVSARRASVGDRAFTLIEMVVVIGIIVLLVAVILPAVTALWNQRKLADASNTIRGMLMSAQRRALALDGGGAGVLFAVDAAGTQRLHPIEQRAVVPTTQGELLARNRFVVIAGAPDGTLPPPMRVVPRYAIYTEDDKAERIFSDLELVNDGFPAPEGFDSEDWEEPQRNRNFFTMVYNTTGQLLIRRDVLIHDADDNLDGTGDRTGLPVPVDQGGGPKPIVDRYFAQTSRKRDTRLDIDPTGRGAGFLDLITDPGDPGGQTAVNFPSVDGLLLYDDAVFADIVDVPSRRRYLMESGQPVYVAGVTGTVILGPIGENEVPK
jgi:prepilin-type N-terminal cleavage/methylation domain-containing protein